MLKKFKSFYKKDKFNISQGYVDPFEFHVTFYKVLVAFKVADLSTPRPPSIFNQNTVLFVNGLIATFFSAISFYHGLETFDIPHMTESGTYAIVLSYGLLILTCTRTNLPQYHYFLRAMKEDFHYICTAGEKYRVKYFEKQLKTWNICVSVCIFNALIPIGMNIFSSLALVYFLITDDGNIGGSRPLLFPFWMFDVDLRTVMIQTQIVWIRQITSKVDIVIWSLQDLLVDISPATTQENKEHFSNLIRSRMRHIVTHHESMWSLLENYAAVYKKILLFEQTICGPIVCLSCYSLAEKFDNGEFHAILLLLCVATIVLHFIPSFMCTYLSSKIKSVCHACFGIPFWNVDSMIRPYLVLIMQRSLRPLPLQTPGFKEVSVETFSQNMASAYSLFNMLRQTNL